MFLARHAAQFMHFDANCPHQQEGLPPKASCTKAFCKQTINDEVFSIVLRVYCVHLFL